MAALLLVLVGISCKKKPTEAGGMELRAPDDKTDVIGGDGKIDNLTPEQLEKYNNEMINIRLISDSSDGVAYYRAPVIVTYGANGMGMGIFYEKRFGQGGADDVGVDGRAKTDIVFMANGRGGDNLTYSSDTKVGSDPSASEGSQYSKASAVVFAKGNNISVVAASGAGTMPIGDRGVSEIKISKGTASGDTITFGNWEELNIKYTNGSTEYSGSEAIREYVKKIGDYNSLYTRWGQGKMDSAGTKWILPLKFRKRDDNGSWNANVGGILILYSENSGTDWKFGPYINLNGTGYADAIGLSVKDNTVKLALTPQNPHNPVGIFSGTLSDYSSNPTAATGITPSGIQDSQNNFEMNAPYFINTRERSSRQINGFLVNKKLTIASLSGEADSLQEQTSMLMSRLAGSGSVAVLSDTTIVTIAEEAFAEQVREGENRFNIVQRRFTKGYVESHARINENEEYYNPNYPEDSY